MKNSEKIMPWYFRSEIAKSYESFYEGKYKEIVEQEKSLLKFLIDQFGKIDRILEVGCGTGYFSRWLYAIGYDVVGIDISIAMLKVARELWNDGKFVNAKAEILPFKDKSFDLVLYIASVEFISDLTSALKEAERVAKKGIVLGLLNKWTIGTVKRAIWSKLGRNLYYRNAKFYSLWSIKRNLKQVLKEPNYELIDWRCAVFPKFLGIRKFLKIPFGGSFLGIGVKFKQN